MAKNQTPTSFALCPRFVFWALRRIQHGRIIINMPDGSTHSFGALEETAVTAQVNVHDTHMFRRLIRSGNTGFAEAYIEGQWSTPDLAALLKILNENMNLFRQHLETVAFMKHLLDCYTDCAQTADAVPSATFTPITTSAMTFTVTGSTLP